MAVLSIPVASGIVAAAIVIALAEIRGNHADIGSVVTVFLAAAGIPLAGKALVAGALQDVELVRDTLPEICGVFGLVVLHLAYKELRSQMTAAWMRPVKKIDDREVARNDDEDEGQHPRQSLK